MPAIPDRRPIVLALHGFTLGGAMFDSLNGLVDAEFVTPDLPGHGGRDTSSCSWPHAVREVCTLIDRHRPDVVLGYSMGGRLCVAAALESDLPFTAVIVSAGVGIADPADRALRRHADEALARRLETIGVEQFAAGWESNDQLGGHPELSALRRANTAAGMAGSLRGLGQGVQPYLGDRLGEITRRTVWVAGADDPKYVAVAREAEAATPLADLVVVAGARHNVVASAPESLAAVLAEAIANRRSA